MWYVHQDASIPRFIGQWPATLREIMHEDAAATPDTSERTTVTDSFVNPYTFVPLPPTVSRRPPPGHLPMAGRTTYSGWIDVAYTLATPMLLPADHEQVLRDGQLTVPGSSVKGAVRSLHEAMFDGCFHIVDLDFIPGYRDAAVSDQAKSASGRTDTSQGSWWLARVLASNDQGLPMTVQLCDEEFWIDSGQLAQRYPKGRLPTTGDVIALDSPDPTWSTIGRYEAASLRGVSVLEGHGDSDERPRVLAPTKGLVFLATDTGARQRWTRPGRGGQRRKGRCLWAAADLSEHTAEVTEAARTDFSHAAAGSEDRRVLESTKAAGPSRPDGWRSGPAFATVTWWRAGGDEGPVARRLRHTGFLWPGDVVWVRLDDEPGTGKVVELRLSNLWRSPGAVAVGDRRLPSALHPCPPEGPHDDDMTLCLTCAIFGSADAEQGGATRGDATDDERRGQDPRRSYGAHVRFGTFTSTTTVTPTQVTLSPLGMPKPGAGMFYLRNDSRPARDRPRGDRLTTWGSSADEGAGGPRQIAGRKFYWHADPDAQARHWSAANGRTERARYVASPEQVSKQAGSMVAKRYLVPTSTRLEGRITFDQLDEPALRSLISAIDPRPALTALGGPSRQYAVHLGGGKPLGLGSATVELTDLHVEELSDRYTSESVTQSPDQVDWRDGVKPIIGQGVKPIIGQEDSLRGLSRTLPLLSRLLDRDGLGEDAMIVSYPPAAGWEDVGTQDFRLSYEFFGANNGEQRAHDSRPWRPLPTLDPSRPQTLPIYRRRGQR